MVICGTQPQKTVPLIASQISDRDNAVRSAALNTMVVVYGNVGDAVFKFTSKVSKKKNGSIHCTIEWNFADARTHTHYSLYNLFLWLVNNP